MPKKVLNFCFFLFFCLNAKSQDTIYISKDTNYIETEMYQFLVKEVFRVGATYHEYYIWGNHYLSADTIFDSNNMPLTITSVRNDSAIFRTEYKYHQDSTFSAIEVYKNDTLRLKEAYSEDGNRVDYYNFLDGNIEQGYTERTYSANHLIRLQEYVNLNGTITYEDSYYSYDSRNILMKIETKDSLGKMQFVQHYISNVTWSISVPSKLETYNYDENGRLDNIVVTNDEYLLETRKYFYDNNNTLDYVIIYNRRGKEKKRIEY